MPFGVKNSFETIVMPTQLHSPVYKGWQSLSDSAHVWALRGAASLLAAQGRDLPQVALTMLVFGFGAALPLLLLGLLSREAMVRWRQRLSS